MGPWIFLYNWCCERAITAEAATEVIQAWWNAKQAEKNKK